MAAGPVRSLYLDLQIEGSDSGRGNGLLKSQKCPSDRPPNPFRRVPPTRDHILRHRSHQGLFLSKSLHTPGACCVQKVTPSRSSPNHPHHKALTAFPFSIQLMVGTGMPIAVQRRVTKEPKVTLWDSGARRILAKTVRKTNGMSDCSL